MHPALAQPVAMLMQPVAVSVQPVAVSEQPVAVSEQPVTVSMPLVSMPWLKSHLQGHECTYYLSPTLLSHTLQKLGLILLYRI